MSVRYLYFLSIYADFMEFYLRTEHAQVFMGGRKMNIKRRCTLLSSMLLVGCGFSRPQFQLRTTRFWAGGACAFDSCSLSAHISGCLSGACSTGFCCHWRKSVSGAEDDTNSRSSMRPVTPTACSSTGVLYIPVPRQPPGCQRAVGEQGDPLVRRLRGR